MDAQEIRKLLAGSRLGRTTETGMSFRFGYDGTVSISSCGGKDGPVCAFGAKYCVAEDGKVELGKEGSGFHLVWEEIEVAGEALSVRWNGRLMEFKFTPGKPRPKPYLP